MITKLLWPIVLQLLGVVVIIAEFVVPSAGILTVVSIAVFGFSLFLVFSSVSINVGLLFLMFDLILIPIVVFFGMRLMGASPATLKATLSSKDGAVSQPPEWNALLNKEGDALTDLHPAGTVTIDGKRHDVVSRGEYITKGSRIIVAHVDSNRIVVKRATNNEYSQPLS
jgi:membrane-bound ClpP family serine protease